MMGGTHKSIKAFIASNKKAWDIVAKFQSQHSFHDQVWTLTNNQYGTLHDRLLFKLKALGIKNKRIIHLCCNDGSELLSIKKMGAGECVGVDFSVEFISQAKNLSIHTGIKCQFTVNDILKLNVRRLGKFDIVLFTAGSLDWIPNVNTLFAQCARLVSAAGSLIIHEIHPLINAFDLISSDSTSIVINKSYWTPKVTPYHNAVSYAQRDPSKKLPVQYAFHHTLSEIIQALIDNNFILTEFIEFPEDISITFKMFEKKGFQVPLSYLMSASKS